MALLKDIFNTIFEAINVESNMFFKKIIIVNLRGYFFRTKEDIIRKHDV